MHTRISTKHFWSVQDLVCVYISVVHKPSHMHVPPIHMCISAELSEMRLNTLLGVMTANAFGLQRHNT